jgi:hypothetical protein
MDTMVAEGCNDGIVGCKITNQGVNLICGDKRILADAVHFAGIEQCNGAPTLLMDDLFGVGFFATNVG